MYSLACAGDPTPLLDVLYNREAPLIAVAASSSGWQPRGAATLRWDRHRT